tara:strand:+ start:4155 stop:4397 length:243 start_codon:yes stop_codon:yes gene_type:complete
MIIDKNNCELNIGDKVRFCDGYTFTIEEVVGGWLWGSDLPEDERFDYGNGNAKNFHNPHYCEKIQSKTSWEGSIIKFNFI